MFISNRSLLVAISLLLIGSSPARAANTPTNGLEIEEVVALQQENPRFPATMRSLGVKSGFASVVLSIDETGAVQDILVAEYSRKAFADSALKSLNNWTFQPARYNGTPFPSTIRLDLDFELGRNLKWQTFTAPVETNITHSYKDEEPVTSMTLRELDAIPLPLRIVEPEPVAHGQATIEFYIDELGNVRCPKLLQGDDLEFGRKVIDAVSQWRFQPPLAAGSRTNAVVTQTFYYQDGSLSTSAPR